MVSISQSDRKMPQLILSQAQCELNKYTSQVVSRLRQRACLSSVFTSIAAKTPVKRFCGDSPSVINNAQQTAQLQPAGQFFLLTCQNLLFELLQSLGH